MLILTPNTGYKFECHDDQALPGNLDPKIVAETWVENVYHIEKSQFGDTGILVDIGANIGVVSTYAASLADHIRVIAIEPEPHNLDYLRRNLDLNGVSDRVTVQQVAVSDYSGSGWINNGLTNAKLSTGKAPDSVQIPVITLAEVFTGNDIAYCDVMKIDVEGAEAAIINGASLDVLRKIGYIALEFDAVPPEGETAFGAMLTKLAKVFNMHVLGSPERGGYVYGHRY